MSTFHRAPRLWFCFLLISSTTSVAGLSEKDEYYAYTDLDRVVKVHLCQKAIKEELFEIPSEAMGFQPAVREEHLRTLFRERVLDIPKQLRTRYLRIGVFSACVVLWTVIECVATTYRQYEDAQEETLHNLSRIANRVISFCKIVSLSERMSKGTADIYMPVIALVATICFFFCNPLLYLMWSYQAHKQIAKIQELFDDPSSFLTLVQHYFTIKPGLPKNRLAVLERMFCNCMLGDLQGDSSKVGIKMVDDIKRYLATPHQFSRTNVYTPPARFEESSIFFVLKSHIQEDLLEVLNVFYENAVKRQANPRAVIIPRVALFWGRPGTGKTETAKELCRILLRTAPLDIQLTNDPVAWYGKSTGDNLSTLLTAYLALYDRSKAAHDLYAICDDSNRVLNLNKPKGSTNTTPEYVLKLFSERYTTDALFGDMPNPINCVITSNEPMDEDAAFRSRVCKVIDFNDAIDPKKVAVLISRYVDQIIAGLAGTPGKLTRAEVTNADLQAIEEEVHAQKVYDFRAIYNATERRLTQKIRQKREGATKQANA